MNILTVEATVFNESQKFSASRVQIRNIFICQFDQKLDDDDTDKEYLDMNYADKLNVLTAVLYSDK